MTAMHDTYGIPQNYQQESTKNWCKIIIEIYDNDCFNWVNSSEMIKLQGCKMVRSSDIY